MMKVKMSFILCALLCAFGLDLHAAYTLKNGKLINARDLATHSVQEHFSFAREAYEQKHWDECLHQATIVIKNFPDNPFSQEVIFYAAVSHFHLKEFDFANRQFSEYLKKEASVKHFEEAIRYKFAIAKHFQEGEKKHLFGSDMLPKWMPAKEDALEIYEEVIAALPHHEIGAQALYGKATLLLLAEEYQESIDALHLLIRRFPKHALAPESYLEIAHIYLTQSQLDYPDPDLLDLAEINLKKFRVDFPTEPRIDDASALLIQMQEVYAKSLYETGRFYERTKKPHAAAIYYRKILVKYAATPTAELSEKRLTLLHQKYAIEKSLPSPIHDPIVQLEPEIVPPVTETQEEAGVQVDLATSIEDKSESEAE